MIRIVFWLLVGSGAIGSCVAAAYYGRDIPFASQWPLYEALRTTASIIFAVVGAWLAIIYPERLKISFGKNNSSGKAAGNVGILLYPAIYSTIILVSVLFVGIAAPVIKQVPVLMAHADVLRSVSFTVLTILTLWQIAVVVMTVIPAHLIKTSADIEQAHQEVLDHKSRLVQTRAPDKP